MIYRYKVIVFKPSGKYYTDDSFDVEDDEESCLKSHEALRDLVKARKIPGLIEGAYGYHVFCDFKEHPMGYPLLIIAEQ